MTHITAYDWRCVSKTMIVAGFEWHLLQPSWCISNAIGAGFEWHILQPATTADAYLRRLAPDGRGQPKPEIVRHKHRGRPEQCVFCRPPKQSDIDNTKQSEVVVVFITASGSMSDTKIQYQGTRFDKVVYTIYSTLGPLYTPLTAYVRVPVPDMYPGIYYFCCYYCCERSKHTLFILCTYTKENNH